MVAAVSVGCAVFATGCAQSQQPRDELMVTDNPVAATAAKSPPAVATPAGTMVALDGTVTAMVLDPASRVLAVAVAEPPAVLLYHVDRLAGTPRSVPLPAPAKELTVAGDTVLAATGRALVRVPLSRGAADSTAVDGHPVSTATVAGRTLVALGERKAVAVLTGDTVLTTITGELFSADQVRSTGDRAVVLDRLRNAVFELDLAAGTVRAGLRAGQGSTNAVTDRFGRVLVADTRGGALLAFGLDPLLLRQRYPVPGAPYGLAYDPVRDLLWVTLTETNEVVGYDVAGGEPVQRQRFPTVAQPNAVTVDPTSGRVIIASANGEGIQVVSNEH